MGDKKTKSNNGSNEVEAPGTTTQSISTENDFIKINIITEGDKTFEIVYNPKEGDASKAYVKKEIKS